MRPLRDFALWSAGYSPTLVREKAAVEDVEQLSKIGGTVIGSACWTGASWGIAFGTYAASGYWSGGVIAAALAGCAGAAFVLLYDRPMLAAIDTHPGGRPPASWLLLRLLIVLAVGTFTSERLLPLLLKEDMQQQALVDREAADDRRQSKLNERFRTADLADAKLAAEAHLRRSEANAVTVPQEISASLAAASACGASVARDRRQLRRQGLPDAVARARTVDRALGCADAARQAQAALSDHRTAMRRHLDEARIRLRESREASSAAASEVSERLTDARDAEAAALTVHSSTVLAHLLISSPIAALKAALLFVIFTAIELMPFICKGYAGRTGLGSKLGASRAITLGRSATTIACAEDENRVAREASAAVSEAMTTALGSEELRRFIENLCAEQARQIAPLEAAVRTLKRAEEQKQEIDAVVARTPELAALAYSLYVEAIRSVNREPQPTPA